VISRLETDSPILLPKYGLPGESFAPGAKNSKSQAARAQFGHARLAHIHEPGCSVGTSYPAFLDWRSRASSFDSLAAYTEDRFGITTLTGILCGLMPVVHSTRPDLHLTLKDGGAAVGGAHGQRLRSLLAGGQLALALMLLAGAGLLIKTTVRTLQSARISRLQSAWTAIRRRSYPRSARQWRRSIRISRSRM
jgi:hypothetical protein